MWVVAKIKYSELDIFKRELEKKLSTKPLFYNPKIQFEKNKKTKIKKCSKSILENYIFCFHESFKSTKLIRQLCFIKGLNFFLDGYNLNQKEINDFINYCKKFENKEGYITQGFFHDENIKKAKFIEGPFINMVFDILSRNKNKLKILIGNIKTTISKNSCYLYRAV